MPARRRWWVVVPVAVCAVALLAGCTDKDLERTLGKQSAAEIESSYRLVDDPLLTTYVNTMGHILVGHAGRQDIPYQFRIIDTDVVNACAAPYGHVYLTRGLLDFVDSEDELWSVTGHEVGHEVNRDTIKAVKENMLLNLATLLIGRESRFGGDLAQLGFNLLSLKHSRDDEYRADDYGATVTFSAGYDPQSEMVFFQRLMDEVEKDHPSRLDTFFMTHPPTKDRIARQEATPTGSLADPADLLQVARGYAQRACYAEAITKLQKALGSRPDLAAARLLLADCYLARGDHSQAAAEYSTVLQGDPSLAAAQQGLRAAQAPAAPARVASASPEQIATAASAVEAAAQAVQSGGAEIAAATQSFPRDLEPAATAVKGGTDSLVALAERPVQLPPSAMRLVIIAASAVNEANESLCTLEQVGAEARTTLAGLGRTMDAAQTARIGTPSSDDAAILARSAREAKQCAQELSGVSGQFPALIKSVQTAGRVAQTCAGRLAQATCPGSMITDRLIAGDTIKLTRQRSTKAREETRAAAEQAALAKTRSLLAEINVAAVALGPDRREAGDNLVAYYTQSEPDAVRALREEHRLGLGETALLLAAAKSSARPVESLLAGAGEPLAVTDAAHAGGAHLQYVNLFLKFIANSLVREAAAS